MKQTPNYQLSQWEKMDRLLMEDFNRDNAKLDAALAEVSASAPASAATLAQHTAAIAKLGNCQIYTTSYVGDGTYGAASPKSMAFPKLPVLLLIFCPNNVRFFAHPDSGMAMSLSGSFTYVCTCSRSGNTISWYSTQGAGEEANTLGYTYQVLALLRTN